MDKRCLCSRRLSEAITNGAARGCAVENRVKAVWDNAATWVSPEALSVAKARSAERRAISPTLSPAFTSNKVFPLASRRPESTR